MRFQYWTVNCLVFGLVSYTAFGCKRGDVQTAATTALISGCVGVGPGYFLQVSQPFQSLLCWYGDGACPGPGSSGHGPSPGAWFPPIDQALTALPSKVVVGEGNRLWLANLLWAPPPCQTKLPLFSQPGPSNYGFHARRREAEPKNRGSVVIADR